MTLTDREVIEKARKRDPDTGLVRPQDYEWEALLDVLAATTKDDWCALCVIDGFGRHSSSCPAGAALVLLRKGGWGC